MNTQSPIDISIIFIANNLEGTINSDIKWGGLYDLVKRTKIVSNHDNIINAFKPFDLVNRESYLLLKQKLLLEKEGRYPSRETIGYSLNAELFRIRRHDHERVKRDMLCRVILKTEIYDNHKNIIDGIAPIEHTDMDLYDKIVEKLLAEKERTKMKNLNI